MNIFSFDAETNGLYGQAFALAAVVTNEQGVKIAEFIGRCPIEGDVNDWVAANVLPNLETMEVNFSSYVDMLNGFYSFYMTHKKDSTVIAHMAHPVETRVLRDMCEVDLGARQWDAPYPLIDVAGVLLAKGENPTSVDEYNKKYSVSVPYEGVTHHPLYDSYAALVCYLHLMGR